MSPKQQRQARLYQNKCRGDRRSYKTDAENLGLLLLWESEVLSEGQVAKALDIDRVTLRMMREGALADALKLAEALLPAPDLTRAGGNTPNVRIEPGR